MSPDLFRSVFDMVNEAIAVTDGNGRILTVNPAFLKLSGYGYGEAEGSCFAQLIAMGLADQSQVALVEEHLTACGRWDGEMWGRRRSGEAFLSWMSISSTCVNNHIRRTIVFRDLTEMRATAEQLWRRTNFDPLTGLPNRGLFLDRFLQGLVMAGRDKTSVGLLFLGLDGFTHINDTLGHTIGDKVLEETAQRIQAVLRQGDTAARFGGDEFTVVLPAVTGNDQVQSVIRQILETIQQPFMIEEHQIILSCSVGACLWPGDGEDVETLMRNATGAMRIAKDAGRNTFRFFTPAMDARAQARARLASELSTALPHGEFHLVYQPIIDIGTGRVASAEALLRWHSPFLGLVSPEQFIPLAEEIGLIGPIGDWLLETACREAQGWQDLTGDPLRIAVNVSPRQFQRGNIAAKVERALKNTGLHPALLTVEITETLMLAHSEEVLRKLEAIRAQGVSVSIDDFGTGYSSLSYLRNFPVDALKIDRAFVQDVDTNPEDATMVQAIIAMAASMGLKVVGEGVEKAAHLAFLAEKGCHFAQGYMFSHPLPADRFRQYILERG